MELIVLALGDLLQYWIKWKYCSIRRKIRKPEFNSNLKGEHLIFIDRFEYIIFCSLATWHFHLLYLHWNSVSRYVRQRSQLYHWWISADNSISSRNKKENICVSSSPTLSSPFTPSNIYIYFLRLKRAAIRRNHWNIACIREINKTLVCGGFCMSWGPAYTHSLT